MSGFGRRQPVESRRTPLASPRAVSAPRGSLPFSWLALLGGACVCALVTLSIYPLLLKAMLVDPEYMEMSPQDQKGVTSFMWRWEIVTGLIAGVVNCIVAHKVARFFGRSDLWLFALAGLVLVPLAFVFRFESANPMTQILVTMTLIAKGPLATSAYWLIAKWRAA